MGLVVVANNRTTCNQFQLERGQIFERRLFLFGGNDDLSIKGARVLHDLFLSWSFGYSLLGAKTTVFCVPLPNKRVTPANRKFWYVLETCSIVEFVKDQDDP
jgi:hypothetical protein